MIEARARVVAIEGDYAWVESERTSGCSHCSSGDTCGVSSLGKIFGSRRMRMRLDAPAGLRAGEAVVIGLSERRLVGAAAAAYMLPLLIMIGIALLGESLGLGQGAVMAASLAGLGAGLWAVRRSVRARRYQPVILRERGATERTLEFEPDTDERSKP